MARKKTANERRKMETELRNLARFPSENPNAILRFDKDGVLLYSNPASKQMLGKMLEESDQKLPEHWHKHVTEALSSGNRLRFEEQINEFIYSFLVAPLVSEGYVGLTCYQCVRGTKAPTEFCPHALTVQDGKEHVAEIYEDNLGGYFAVS